MDISRFTLSNNMKVALSTEHGLPIVEMRGWTRAGPALDSRRSVAGAVLNMLKRGTKARTRDQFESELDRYGLVYGLGISHFSPFFIDWEAMAMKRYVGELLRLVCESFCFPLFPEKEFELVKKSLLAKARIDASDPMALVMKEIPKMIFGPLHPSYAMSSEESITQLRNIATEDLRFFWDAHYVPDQSGIALVGDFDSDEMLNLVRRVFETWNRKSQNFTSIKPAFDLKDYAANQGYEERTIFASQKSNAVLAIGQGIFMPDSNHPDYPALLVAVRALGDGSHSRLFQHVRERCGLSYHVAASLEEMNGAPGYLLVIAHTNPENMQKTQKETFYVIEEFWNGGITQEELDQERLMHRGGAARSSASRKGMARDIASSYIMGRSTDEFNKKIGALTLDQVNAAIRKYINPAKMKVARAGTIT